MSKSDAGLKKTDTISFEIGSTRRPSSIAVATGCGNACVE